MSSSRNNKNKKKDLSNNTTKEDAKTDNPENEIKLVKRTKENNTHEVIEDKKLKRITSWRKSEKKFLQNLVYNILSLGILHIISLFYPNLYLKLYCNPRPPKECDFFLVENIYGNLTLCTKIHKKAKNNEMNFNSTKDNIASPSIMNSNNRMDCYLTKNLTYSFKYKSTTYEYNEETNEIIPVYMDLSKMTNKGIFNFFGEGLSSENILKKFKERYGKNTYYINMKIIYFYFVGIEVPCFIIILIIGVIEFFLDDFVSFFAKLTIVFLVVTIEFIVAKLYVYDLYEREFTLDGEKNMIKVKRKHKLENNTNFYQEIKNCDILPGDIIYLKSNDYVPCDCLILEGDCIVNESNLTGNLNIYKKCSLENNNELFNYEYNRINILYHGMKIIKSFSKFNEGYISVLCINIGGNTYKANLFSNILYLFEKTKKYKEMYSLFGNKRKIYLILILINIFFSLIIGYVYYNLSYSTKMNFTQELLKLLLLYVLRIICKSFMPVYLLTKAIIFILGIIHLKKENIVCFEKSKLLSSSTIDTIFFSKSGTLCENKIEINGYHPTYINQHKSNSIGYRTYTTNQYKEMNSQLVKYYNDYLHKSKNNTLIQENNLRHALRMNQGKLNLDKKSNESCECTTLFLECLLSCNNLEKYNIEIFGNPIDTFIFKNMRWDIKSSNNNNNNNNDNYKNDTLTNKNKCFGLKANILDKTRNDIYPSNYYKITESIKNENISSYKPVLTRLNSKFYLDQMKKTNSTESNQGSLNSYNYIKYDISQSNINSYKLRIYKRFTKDGTLNSSAIVYNFITKELRFMTKGIPEDLLDKCDANTLPDYFDKTISLYRKSGFIIIACASKIINIDDYKDSNSIEDYMSNLTFCGFVTLKSKLKKTIINSIKDLGQFDCNMILSTGDNVFNSLSVGFESKIIIDNKNIFSLDKDDKKNGIIITKIYSNKKLSEQEKEAKIKIQNLEKISKETSKISNRNKILSSPFTKFKDINIRSSQTKKGTTYNEFLINQTEQETSKRDGENKQLIPRNYKRKGSINKYLKSTRYLNNFDRKMKSINRPRLYTDITETKNSNNNFNKETAQNSRNSNNINYLSFIDKSQQIDEVKKSNPNIENRDFKDSFTNRNNKNKISYLEKYHYYPGIFKDIEDLDNNCIYCVSGKAFNFLYKNKDKKQCKFLLEKIHKYCKIFFSMTSIDKSLAIDYYMEYPDSCICKIGECQNDYDAIMTSDVGISLQPPKNRNTLLSHFLSLESDILSIKKIIREGRAIKENIMLLRISCVFYTLIINSYIICCFIRQINVVIGQLNFLEICFLILSIMAFTGKTDKTKKSNPLIKKKKLYVIHYCIQIIGMTIIKLFIVYIHGHKFVGNQLLDSKYVDSIYVTYYFALCTEQLFSTIFVLNLISFYRKDSILSNFYIFVNLLLLAYFVTLLTLNSSNYKFDLFNFLSFEYLDNNIDSFDDNNKINCFLTCLLDFFSTIIYSRIIYFIFGKLALINL